MKHLLKGAIAAAIIIILNLIIHIFCNMHDISLDQTATGAVSAVCAMFLYQGMIKNEK